MVHKDYFNDYLHVGGARKSLPKETLQNIEENEEDHEIGFYERVASSSNSRQSLKKSFSRLKSFESTPKLPPIVTQSSN